MEIAKANPKESVPEKIKPVFEKRYEMKVGISSQLEAKLKQIKDILSQKKKKGCSTEEALEEMAELFLEKNDPIRKATRSLALRKVRSKKTKQTGKRRQPVDVETKHKITLRDENQCAHEDENGRCSQKRWLETHHRIHFAQGGTNHLENLTTLCANHHKNTHSFFKDKFQKRVGRE